MATGSAQDLGDKKETVTKPPFQPRLLENNLESLAKTIQRQLDEGQPPRVCLITQLYGVTDVDRVALATDVDEFLLRHKFKFCMHQCTNIAVVQHLFRKPDRLIMFEDTQNDEKYEKPIRDDVQAIALEFVDMVQKHHDKNGNGITVRYYTYQL